VLYFTSGKLGVAYFALSGGLLSKFVSEFVSFMARVLNNETRKLIADISKEDHWPVGKNVLVNKYLKQITKFVKSIEYGNMQSINMCKRSELTFWHRSFTFKF
jgi:ubiquinone/menaquinone biosynthesis C-methylase UbiE